MRINIETVIKFQDYLDKKTFYFILISFMHYNKIIKDEKLKAMFRSLREDKFLRMVKTHRSNIDREWYNNEYTGTIIKEIWDENNKNLTSMEYKEFHYYLNLFLNANWNYCLNYFYLNIVKPIIKSSIRSMSYLTEEYATKHLNSFDLTEVYFQYPKFSRSYFFQYYDDYDDNSLEKDEYERRKEKETRIEFSKIINNMKKGSWRKSMNCEMLDENLY